MPKAPAGRILQNAGAKRVSEKAMAAFADILEQKALEIGGMAVKMAKHSGRKTVQAPDIKLAARR